jgi:MoaA/NifB/PqqE/SkfB family radical SAM enzyme
MSYNKETFCLAPWYSIYLNSKGNISPCCKFKNPKKTYSYNKIEEYFNSTEIEQVRQDLVKGVKNHNCNKCWKDERNGGDSLRLITNRTIALHSKVNLQEQIDNPKTSNIKSFDLTLGNLCNLKCVMCSPTLSSQLLVEAKLNNTLQRRYGPEENQKDFNWPKGEDFVEWCNRYLPEAIHIKFTGGEPFLVPWIYDVIRSIPDEQKSRCVLHFTTNLTIINDKLFEEFRKFKEVWISVSVEGTSETFEYLRYGHSWAKLSSNIKSILSKKISNLMFKVNHVVQTPSYHSITDMTKFFDDLGMEIHPILLTSPKHYHVSSLTKRSKQEFLDQTKEYRGHNINFINFVRSVTQENIEQDSALTKACMEDLSALDRVRGNDYKKIIPKYNLEMH